jgi:N-glycosylase/DNA lyase
MKLSGEKELLIRQLQRIYRAKKKEIVYRLGEFASCLNDKKDRDILIELSFCLLTPQSKALCCWDAIRTIDRHNLLLTGSEDDIKGKLHRVRFHNKKARYLVGARGLFIRRGKLSIKNVLRHFSDVYECREWLVKNIKGLGYKEASHFLRNIGMGDQVAILDRHILRNLLYFGVIQEIPASLGKTRYLEIEHNMAEFARAVRIPLAHLDLLLWYKETGEIFK